MGYFAVNNLRLDNKYGNMLPKDSPAQRDYLSFKQKFGEDGGTLVIAIKTKDLYTEENFRIWKQLGDTILQQDGVESVTSEATLVTLHNLRSENRFEPRRVFSDIEYKEKSIDSIRKEVRNSPLYDKLLFNKATGVSLMMIKINEEFLSNQKKSKVVLDVENLAVRYEKNFGKVHFAGMPHIRVIVGKRIQKEMFIFVGAVILVTSLLLYLFFRSIRVVIICNIVVFVSVIWSLGTIGLFDFPLTILMALIPPLMIVIGIPNCIFLVTKFHQEYAQHRNKIKALTRVIQKIGTATFLTNLTTSLGFATFIFTNSEKLVSFGIIAAINVMVVFVISICIMPIAFSLSNPPKERHIKHLDRTFAVGLVEGLVRLTSTRRTWIYMVTLGFIGISIYGITCIKATGNLTGDLPPGDPILKDLKFIEKNFGGSIPFEMMIDYKSKGRLFKKSTLTVLEDIQAKYALDKEFSRSISIVDFVKLINMAYYNNNPENFTLISRSDQLRLKKYVDNLNMANVQSGSFSLKELVDTAKTTLRIRMQLKDLGSYEIATKIAIMKRDVDSMLNPDKKAIERLYAKAQKNPMYYDSIFENYSSVTNSVTSILSSKNSDLQYKFDTDPNLIKSYYKKADFKEQVRAGIDLEYFDCILTGTSVVASEGTQYLVTNLFSSLAFAIISIAILMAILFRSWRMVMVSLIPNLIPLVMTAGIMGIFGIPIKPSTILVFSIAFGISVDDTIHYLAKYRQELKEKNWDIKNCVLLALRESGLGMFYTSIVLFCGFITFTLSEFGGTQALGLLISLTLLIAMITNLLILPSLLLTLEKRLTSRAFIEPYFEVFDEESDIDYGQLLVQRDSVDNDDNTELPDEPIEPKI